MANHHALEKLIQIINAEAIPFSLSDESFYDQLLEKIGDTPLVLMGEATHGTEEFYQTRIEISKRLIEKKNFNAIAIEGDWTSTWGIHRFITTKANVDVNAALKGFKRFPTWMWRNETIPPFLLWLKNFNDKHEENEKKIGFYGLDLYCLNEAMQAVIDYLNKYHPDVAQATRKRYACFDHATFDPQTYGYLVEAGVKKACVKEVTAQLITMQQLAYEEMLSNTMQDDETLFYATQNALVVKNAEEYYRAMFQSRDITWNLRDQHMATTLDKLTAHIAKKTTPKIIIWAHNSHVGDARVTERSDHEELNLGQIVREQYECFLLGFSTYTGTVTAASDWGKPPQRMSINPGMPGSYEELFHQIKIPNFMLDLHNKELQHFLHPSRLQRAIGVVYRPETERMSHYFFTQLPRQFDAVIHIDKTNAVKPLDILAALDIS